MAVSLKEKFEELARDAYQRPNERCNIRAIKMARAIKEAGKESKIVKIISKERTRILVPAIPRTKLWSFHYVCIDNNDFVYDPSIGVRLERENYVQYIFPNQSVEFIESSDSAQLISEPLDEREVAFARGV